MAGGGEQSRASSSREGEPLSSSHLQQGAGSQQGRHRLRDQEKAQLSWLKEAPKAQPTSPHLGIPQQPGGLTQVQHI